MEQEVVQNPPISAEGKVTFKSAWRPLLAYCYVLIVVFDFVIAPAVMTGIYKDHTQPTAVYYLQNGFTAEQAITLHQSNIAQQSYVQWDPLTLKAGGFFHIAMGGVLGIGSWTRGREKEALAKK